MLQNLVENYFKLVSLLDNYHLLTETEGNSVFCGPETVDVSRGEAEGNMHRLSRVHKTHCFPEVSVNKCFIIYQ